MAWRREFMLVQNAYRFRTLPMKIILQGREQAGWAYNGAVLELKNEVLDEMVRSSSEVPRAFTDRHRRACCMEKLVLPSRDLRAF